MGKIPVDRGLQALPENVDLCLHDQLEEEAEEAAALKIECCETWASAGSIDSPTKMANKTSMESEGCSCSVEMMQEVVNALKMLTSRERCREPRMRLCRIQCSSEYTYQLLSLTSEGLEGRDFSKEYSGSFVIDEIF